MNADSLLARFEVASEPGNERTAIDLVANAVAASGLTDDQTNRLKTAVAEATMNAIEHGNLNRPDLDVELCVYASRNGIAVTISDHGLGDHGLALPAVPDIDQKLAGLQSPRGWGLFLIKNMVDAVQTETVDGRPTVRLEMFIAEGAEHGPHGRSQQV